MRQIFAIDEKSPYETPAFASSSDVHRLLSSAIPIVIDHGSWQTRAGWAGEKMPRVQFDTLVAKVRDKALGEQVAIVGEEVNKNFGADRSNVRSSFDQGTSVVVHPEFLEYEMDYVFNSMGITEAINSPVLITETLCNPSASRQVVNELMFECYDVPAVSYGIDAVFSAAYNGLPLKDGGVVVSCGYNSTTLIPIFNGSIQHQLCKRISVGGIHTVDFMLRLLQHKYPTFPLKVSYQQALALVNHHTRVAEDYLAELRRFENIPLIEEDEHVIQFPFNPMRLEKTEEELQEIERKKELQRERMKQQAAVQREERLATKEAELAELVALKQMKDDEPEYFTEKLFESGFENEAELVQMISKAQATIKRMQMKIAGEEVPEEPKEKPTFPLVDIPDDQLDEDQRKEKRKQKLLRASHEAREKAREEKERQKQLEAEEERKEEERRLADPQAWINSIKEKRLTVLNRMNERKKEQEMLTDRRSRVSQSRMKTIASLASDAQLTSSGRKRRKKAKEDDDNFGIEDDDWAVYRDIKKENDEEEEEEDQQQLEHYTNLLLQHDPDFVTEEEMELEKRKDVVYYRLKYGPKGFIDPADEESHHQIRLNVERIRVPEILFQPSMVGSDEAGIIETLSTILRQFQTEQRDKIVQNIFITGSHSLFPGIQQRIEREVRMLRPYQSLFKVKHAQDPRLDAWKGAAQWAGTLKQDQIKKLFVSRHEYDEHGHEYLKEHVYSNKFYQLC